jgi:hypothetical protein
MAGSTASNSSSGTKGYTAGTTELHSQASLSANASSDQHTWGAVVSIVLRARCSNVCAEYLESDKECRIFRRPAGFTRASPCSTPKTKTGTHKRTGRKVTWRIEDPRRFICGGHLNNPASRKLCRTACMGAHASSGGMMATLVQYTCVVHGLSLPVESTNRAGMHVSPNEK